MLASSCSCSKLLHRDPVVKKVCDLYFLLVYMFYMHNRARLKLDLSEMKSMDLKFSSVGLQVSRYYLSLLGRGILTDLTHD